LEQLELEGVIPWDLRQEAERLYGQLNGAIHSNENRLIHRGAEGTTWIGRQFKQDQYSEWCQHFADAVRIGVRLLASMLALHLQRPHPEGLTCSRCQGLKTFAIVAQNSARVTVRCSQCSYEFDLVPEVAHAYGIGQG
jgi:hypothetical protein